MAQVEVRDEHGNRVELTDAFGNPVWLTDEKGNPVHLTAVAHLIDTPQHPPLSNTSTSTTYCEDEGHGGVSNNEVKNDNIKEKVPSEGEGGGEGNEDSHTRVTSTATTENEKKSIIDKIKEKFQ